MKQTPIPIKLLVTIFSILTCLDAAPRIYAVNAPPDTNSPSGPTYPSNPVTGPGSSSSDPVSLATASRVLEQPIVVPPVHPSPGAVYNPAVPVPRGAPSPYYPPTTIAPPGSPNDNIGVLPGSGNLPPSPPIRIPNPETVSPSPVLIPGPPDDSFVGNINRGSSASPPGNIELANPVSSAAVSGGSSPGVVAGGFSEFIQDNGAPLQFQPFYNQGAASTPNSPMGPGWNHNYNIGLTDSGSGQVVIQSGNGSRSVYTQVNGNYVSPPGDFTALTKSPTDGTYHWTWPHGTVYTFDSSTNHYLATVTDRNSNSLTMYRTGTGLLTNVYASTGRSISLIYNGNGQIQQVIDPIQTNVFSYNSAGQLIQMSNSLGSINYGYQSTNLTYLTSRQNRLGGTATFAYDSSGIPQSEADPGGNVTQYNWINGASVVTAPNGHSVITQYDPNGRLTALSDEAGVVPYLRNANGLVTNYVDRLGDATQYAYDNSGNLKQITNPLGQQYTYTYGANNLPISYTAPGGATTAYSRNSQGNVTNILDSLNHSTAATYDNAGNLTVLTDANNNQTHFYYDGANQVTDQVDAMGNATQYSYDTAGRVIQTVNPVGAQTVYSWDSGNRLLSIIGPSGDTTTLTRDGDGNVTSVINPVGGFTRMTYNPLNEVIEVAPPVPGTSRTFAYDSMGNRTNITDGLGHTTTLNFNSLDDLSSVVNADGATWNYVSDAEGRMIQITDPNGHVNGFLRDALGRTIAWTNALNQVTTLQYDTAGNCTQIKDPRENALSFGYDSLRRVTSLTLAGASSAAFQYDSLSNITNFTNRAGQAISLAYDAGNRVVQKQFVGGNSSVNYSYDAAHQCTNLIWTTGSVTNSCVQFAYDASGRWTNEVQGVTGATPLSIGYAYYLDGRRRQLTYPDGSFITYQYNSNGWLTAILDGGTNTIVSYEYDAAGRCSQRTLENSTFTVYNYDNANRVTNIWHQLGGGGTVSQYQYGYDAVGNRLWMKRAGGTGDVYGYDAANQLTNALYGANNPSVSPSGWTNSVGYNFDAAGNRTSVVQVATSTNVTVYDVNTLNQYTNVAATAYTYDAKGNLTSDGTWTYSYDYENRLVQASKGLTTIAYTYDPLGRLIERKTNGVPTRYYYAGLQLIAEYDSTGTVVAKYVYGSGIDEPIRMNRGGTNYYYHADALGSITEITDSTGATVEQYSYDVYGSPSIKNGSGSGITASAIGNRLMFTGRDLDPDTGLYNFRYRYYSPTLGRFAQSDPLGIFGGDIINWYRYAMNNPLTWVDPFGLTDWGKVGGGLLHIAIGITEQIGGAVGLMTPGLEVVGVVGLAGGFESIVHGAAELASGFGGENPLENGVFTGLGQELDGDTGADIGQYLDGVLEGSYSGLPLDDSTQVLIEDMDNATQMQEQGGTDSSGGLDK